MSKRKNNRQVSLDGDTMLLVKAARRVAYEQGQTGFEKINGSGVHGSDRRKDRRDNNRFNLMASA